MARKKSKRVKTESKYLKDAISGTTTITRIEILNMWTGDKYKSVFYVPSSKLDSGERMCIVWGRANIQIGDTIQITGRISGDVFLCWSYLILKRKEEEKKVVNG